jgi:hypothetical protein
MMSLKTGRIVVLAATVAALLTMSVATTPASAAGTIKPLFKNWVVSGTLTPKKLNEPVTLPQGSTFNGGGTIEIEYFAKTKSYAITGTITGALFVPPFSASLKLLGIVPTTVGVTFTQVGEAVGTVVSAPSADCGGEPSAFVACVTLSVPTKANVGITSVGTLGVGVPTTCETSSPVVFALSTTLTLAELADTGPHFKGTTTIPPLTCSGPEALVLAPTLSAVMSGPGNAYALTIAP